MKAMIVAFAMVSYPAFAANMFDFGKISPKLAKFKMTPEKVVRPPNAPVLQPIRMAHVKASIYKVIQEVDRNGSVSVRWEDVCKVEGDTPVYDVRGLNEYTVGADGLECASTYNNKPVKVALSTTVMLYRWKIFDDEAEADSKFVGGGLWVNGTANANYISYDSWSTGTRDLAATSFIGTIGSAGPINCVEDRNGNMVCNVVPSENFQATFEITDK